MRYPGDDYVDVFGIDRYTSGTVDDVVTYYELAYEASVRHGKVFAITEGLRNLDSNPMEDFWTNGWLNKIISNSSAKKAAYINFYADHWWCKEDRSDAPSFLAMSQNPKIRMLSYQRNKINNARLNNCVIR